MSSFGGLGHDMPTWPRLSEAKQQLTERSKARGACVGIPEWRKAASHRVKNSRLGSVQLNVAPRPSSQAQSHKTRENTKA